MKHHRFTEIWPLITGSDFEELKADIAAYGQRMPIVTYKGEVLDGRNRERACEALGIEPQYEEAEAKSDNEALELVFSLNQHRRHLSNDERAFAAAALANLKPGSNRFIGKKIIERPMGPSTNLKTITLDDAANKMKVSVQAVKRARRIVDHGDPEDKEEVLSGKVSLRKKSDDIMLKRKRAAATATKPRVPREGPRLVFATRGLPPGRALTREEVDPEFTGTPTEFVDKYRHVQKMNAAEYATMYFGNWAANMKSLARMARDLPDWPNVDHNWLRQPKPFDIAKLADALAYLRPKLAEAEKLLERAQQSLEQKKQQA